MERLRIDRMLAGALALLLGAGILMPVNAQDADDMQRGVARISLIDAEVSVRRGDSAEWVAAVVNAPLLTEDRIATGPNSRAEVQFDAANVIRIGANAEVRLVQLEAARFQVELAHGTITYRVLRPSSANAEVDTPSVSVRPSRQGIYRISVNDAGETEIIARAGEVEVFTPRGSQWVTAGQTMMARGSASDPEYQIVASIAPDDWDRWNDSRDQAMLQTRSYEYVGPGVYGVEDLDNYGSWVDVPEYGHVWRPTSVAEDWAPYRAGRWAWEDWYGWTWVSYDPWGWAPYHYGRWFHEPRYGWCWYPGLTRVRHYWSPALVAFFGYGGGGFGVGFGFGNVGWVPLAPYEVFHPWWGRNYYGRGFNRGFNYTNINITNVYRNARARNGISGVAAGDFRSGRFNNVARVSGDQVRQAGLVRGQMPISPESNHLRFSDRNVANVPRSRENVRFFSHQQPNPVSRVPLSQQVQGVRGDSSARGMNGMRGNAGTAGGFRSQQNSAPLGGGSPRTDSSMMQNTRPQGQSQGPGNRGGFRGFDGTGQNQAPQNAAPRNESAPRMENGRQSQPRGWSRFGDPSGSQGPGTMRSAPQNTAPRNESVSPRGVGRSQAFENSRPAPSGNEMPQSRGGWQRFGEPGGGARQQYAPPARSAPSSESGAYNAPRSRGNGGFDSPAPRSYSAPSYPSSRGNGGGGFNSPSPRSYSAPSNPAPSYSAPSYPSPRGNGGGGGGGFNGPRGGGFSSPAPRSYSAPSYSAPSYSAPRGGGGGGGFSGPRGGGGFSAPSPRSNSAPSYSAPRGGGFSAPRSSGGGGGGGGFSAPRSSGGGGGGGFSAPRSSGGGGGGGGGNASRGNGGGGGSHAPSRGRR